MKKYILVTGGAGYIGSHMARLLIESGERVIIFDNLSTGVKAWVPKQALFIQGDLCEKKDLNRLFMKYPVETVAHFAANINVPESIVNPCKYYRNNVGATAILLSAMIGNNVRRIVFSSTAAVYGNTPKGRLTEKTPAAPVNPYGTSKLMCEKMLQDISKAGMLDFIILRYFNVAGWDTRYLWPTKGRPQPTHLIANVIKAIKSNVPMTIWGKNYPTADGTGVRDFIHVIDLCRAHILAVKALEKKTKDQIFNLGNEKGFSVMDVIKTASLVSTKAVPHKIGPRRPGDVANVIACCVKAKKVLAWKPQLNLLEIVKSEWERQNP